jgi:hypothetical protein
MTIETTKTKRVVCMGQVLRPNEVLDIIYIIYDTIVHIRANPPVRPNNFLQILKEYKFRTPLNFTFNCEINKIQQGY